MTDCIGAVVQLFAFDAYGNALGFDPKEALTEFLYSGEQFDAKIGQQYLRARYYDPATGRFNRLDPFFGNLSDPQSFHKYLYAHADPINMTDPSGLFGVAGISVSISIGQVMSGMNSYAAMVARQTACGAVSGALVGSIMGALLEACKQADQVMHGNSPGGSDATLSIIISALQGAGDGLASGAQFGLKNGLSFGFYGRYDQARSVTDLKRLNETYSQIITLFGEGKYFEASFVGLSTLIDLGLGPQLNSLFCFVDDTLVMLENDEINEAEATVAVEEQIGAVGRQYGQKIAWIMSVVLIGLVIHSHLNRKRDREEHRKPQGVLSPQFSAV